MKVKHYDTLFFLRILASQDEHVDPDDNKTIVFCKELAAPRSGRPKLDDLTPNPFENPQIS